MTGKMEQKKRAKEKTLWQKMWEQFDWPLAIVYIILLLLGIVMVYSASLYYVALHESGLDINHYQIKQIQHSVVALTVFIIFSLISYKKYTQSTILALLYIGTGLLLLAVYLPGFGLEEGGANRWVRLGPITFQPAELAKIVIILYLSRYFARRYEDGDIHNPLRSLTSPIIAVVIFAGLIVAQTDLGSTLILLTISYFIFYYSGMSKRSIIRLTLIAIAIVVAFVLITLAIPPLREWLWTENRIGRITSYLDPFAHQRGSGFQVVHSYIAIALGGVTGAGLGNSIQKMGYLPAPYTDFVMAIVAEELGMIGVILVLGGIGFIVYRALWVAAKSKDVQRQLMGVGIATLFTVQTFLNVGGLTGLIPLTGVPLPFISYGGTSLILLSLTVGILMNLVKATKLELESNKRSV